MLGVQKWSKVQTHKKKIWFVQSDKGIVHNYQKQIKSYENQVTGKRQIKLAFRFMLFGFSVYATRDKKIVEALYFMEMLFQM